MNNMYKLSIRNVYVECIIVISVGYMYKLGIYDNRDNVEYIVIRVCGNNGIGVCVRNIDSMIRIIVVYPVGDCTFRSYASIVSSRLSSLYEQALAIAVINIFVFYISMLRISVIRIIVIKGIMELGIVVIVSTSDSDVINECICVLYISKSSIIVIVDIIMSSILLLVGD